MIDINDLIDGQERREDHEPYGFASDELPFNGQSWGTDDAAAKDASMMTFEEWQSHWRLIDGDLVNL